MKTWCQKVREETHGRHEVHPRLNLLELLAEAEEVEEVPYDGQMAWERLRIRLL